MTAECAIAGANVSFERLTTCLWNRPLGCGMEDMQSCTPGIMDVNTSDAAETLTHSKYPHCVNHSTKMKDFECVKVSAASLVFTSMIPGVQH
jgi:hypothetical protein